MADLALDLSFCYLLPAGQLLCWLDILNDKKYLVLILGVWMYLPSVVPPTLSRFNTLFASEFLFWQLLKTQFFWPLRLWSAFLLPNSVFTTEQPLARFLRPFYWKHILFQNDSWFDPGTSSRNKCVCGFCHLPHGLFENDKHWSGMPCKTKVF